MITPKLETAGDGLRLRDFLRESGYDELNTKKALVKLEPYAYRLRNLPRLLDRTREPTRLNALLRWFFIGVPVEESWARSVIPEPILDLCLRSRLLYPAEDGMLASPVEMRVLGELIIASDFAEKFESSHDPDLVLGLNDTARVLSHFTIRRPVGSALDLGTGCGVQGLVTAEHSERVLATDLNDRAVAIAGFNVRLNGLEDRIECRRGDLFEPAGDETFDLIASNPPFFITPSTGYLFRDSPFELDGFCRHLIRQAPARLNEGGFLQMTCEWVEIEGQPWQERLREWFDGLGCDAWVLQAYEYELPEYTLRRLPTADWNNPEKDAGNYEKFMEYYARYRVHRVYGGFIALRKRSGRNWQWTQNISIEQEDPFGDAVLEGFQIRDSLCSQNGSEEGFLDLRPYVPDSVRLHRNFKWHEGEWHAVSGELRRAGGFCPPLSLDVHSMRLMLLCDGERTVEEMAGQMAESYKGTREHMRKQCSKILRTMLERAYLALGPRVRRETGEDRVSDRPWLRA